MIEAYSNNITVSSNSLVPLKKEGKAVPDSMWTFTNMKKLYGFSRCIRNE